MPKFGSRNGPQNARAKSTRELNGLNERTVPNMEPREGNKTPYLVYCTTEFLYPRALRRMYICMYCADQTLSTVLSLPVASLSCDCRAFARGRAALACVSCVL